jgi:hypothetical protein
VAAQADEVESVVAQGIELRVAGRDAEALERFRRAAALSPESARIKGHLALALHAQKEWVESESIMLEVLSSPDDEWVARHLGELRQSLVAVQSHLAWLEVDAEAPADLWLDDHYVGALPMKQPLRLVAKETTLELRTPRGTPIRRVLQIPAGQHLRLASLESSADKRPNVEFVKSKPAAPKAGVRAPKASNRTPASLVGAALVGAGAASLAAGIGFGINAFLLRHQRDKECTAELGCSADGIALDARGRQSARSANVFLGVGVVGMGVGVAILW